ncbi:MULTISPECIES: CmpA/NrtA family ABC transporter substrate-binding protein [Achromobacter]|uniref:CmpA/NrtA family ABC transporter substrate-binding protein n=1 Tax=Achromobacter spanius TaxID=217203 RepID=A0ABY8H1V3_9BURK|nr:MULTISPECIES: CmpA/NrtA family ABC transporter substrate-binding protein [Achromobacter]WAI85426.1 ABC transporter substrate-binding protein [Achromobacter spanius]WEX95508.1 ABC transporter substrate-binding protein [Achromobacter sp. SS2-2022]WFP10771.1 CmpA/NrtA family ABC transporter substrate-binding protein [Achromobacter spanius]
MTPVQRSPSSDLAPHADAGANASRRKWLSGTARAVAGAGLLSLVDPLVRAGAWAAGTDAPEKTEVKIGFIPLTDCASVVMASVLGIDKKYGVTITPSKEASWAAVRDKLLNGELDMAHVLYGLVYGVHLGIGGPKKDMAVLMSLNQNGQAISLSNKVLEGGARDGESLAKLMASDKREYTFAQTFPTGTHAMWLYYWLAAYGINPMKDAKVITVPPPQMVANMRVGNMDGFCVGEPWGARTIMDKIGFTAVTSQDIWQDHPEKVLGTSADFVARNPNTARAVTAAILEAGKWIDASPANRQKTAETIAAKSYVNTDASGIVDRMLGKYQDGLGKTWTDEHAMRFYADGSANFPYLSDGMWFLTQHKRWGLLKEHPDYLAVAKQINRIDLYKQAAQAAGVALPTSETRTSTLIDGVKWDGSNPAAYADGFKVKV